MQDRWNRIIEDAFGKGARIVFPRYFESKKNQVTLLELSINGASHKFISKFFVRGDPDVEWRILEQAYEKGVPAPRPVKRCGEVIFMEYVPGKSTKALLEKNPDTFKPAPLGSWLSAFHRAFPLDGGRVMLKGDVMLPNFIIEEKSGRIFGIDFEECRPGDPMEDLANLMASVMLGGGPSFETGAQRCREVARGYLEGNPVAISEDNVRKMMRESLNRHISYVPQRESAIREIIKGLDEGFFPVF